MSSFDPKHSPSVMEDSVLEKKEIHSGDVDEALAYLDKDVDVGEVLNEVDDKKLMRKVDWAVMPLMFMCYYLQYSDKTLINYAAVMGLIENTNMPPNGFAHLAIAFYCSFLFAEPIQAYLIQKLPTAKWLGVNVVLWGIVLTMNSVCKSYAPLIVLRVLLGIFESATAPSLNILTTMFYKRHEQTVRIGYWYQGTSIGPAVSSMIAYGFAHWAASHPNAPFKAWQALFLLYGLITIATGVLVFFFLPDSPMKGRFTADEKRAIIERVRENQTGIENRHFKPSQLKELALDPKTWLLFFIVVSTNIPNGAVSSFSSIIIENFGYNKYETLLLNLPGCAVAFVVVWLGTWYGGKYNSRGIVIIAMVIPTLIGGALMAWLAPTNKSGLLAGNYLTNTVGASLPLMYSWVTANYAGHTKKVAMNALILIAFCVGNVIGPETFQAKSAPQYIPAKITIVAVLSVSIVLVVALDLLYMRENRKRDQAGEVEMPANYEFMDLTDKENRNFRYLL